MPSSNILLPQTGILGYGCPALLHHRWKILGDPLCLYNLFKDFRGHNTSYSVADYYLFYAS